MAVPFRLLTTRHSIPDLPILLVCVHYPRSFFILSKGCKIPYYLYMLLHSHILPLLLLFAIVFGHLTAFFQNVKEQQLSFLWCGWICTTPNKNTLYTLIFNSFPSYIFPVFPFNCRITGVNLSLTHSVANIQFTAYYGIFSHPMEVRKSTF